MRFIVVPLMLACAGILMSLGWIGHLKFKAWSFWTALFVSWMFVLPEYILGVFSMRLGREVFSAAQMGAIRLGSGAIGLAIVSALYLGESMTHSQVLGFLLLGISLVLIMAKL